MPGISYLKLILKNLILMEMKGYGSVSADCISTYKSSPLITNSLQVLWTGTENQSTYWTIRKCCTQLFIRALNVMKLKSFENKVFWIFYKGVWLLTTNQQAALTLKHPRRDTRCESGRTKLQESKELAVEFIMKGWSSNIEPLAS